MLKNGFHVTIMILVLLTGCTQPPPPPPAPLFEISPRDASVTEGVQGMFTISITNAPFDMDPQFSVVPYYSKDFEVLTIDDRQLREIGHLNLENSISKNIFIRGRVVYGRSATYPIRVILLDKDKNKDYTEEIPITLTVTR